MVTKFGFTQLSTAEFGGWIANTSVTHTITTIQ
jgi:hypothetical protein